MACCFLSISIWTSKFILDIIPTVCSSGPKYPQYFQMISTFCSSGSRSPRHHRMGSTFCFSVSKHPEHLRIRSTSRSSALPNRVQTAQMSLFCFSKSSSNSSNVQFCFLSRKSQPPTRNVLVLASAPPQGFQIHRDPDNVCFPAPSPQKRYTVPRCLLSGSGFLKAMDANPMSSFWPWLSKINGCQPHVFFFPLSVFKYSRQRRPLPCLFLCSQLFKYNKRLPPLMSRFFL